MFECRVTRAVLTMFIILTAGDFAAAAVKRPSEDNLTRAFAEQRRAQIKSVDYELSVVLNKGSDDYKGKATLLVELNKSNEPLSVDFVSKQIESVTVNGAPITDFETRKGSFDIPAKYLAQKMAIEVAYTSEYSKTGDGFQKVKDPEDGNEYAYTDFEPYAAHTFLPCFDQPDLKGTIKVTVDAPSDWKAIANDLVEKSERKGDRTTTVFAKSKPISTYLYFVGAGPFVEWTEREGSIPLYLYARKSLAKYVDHDRIFETTKKGLRFYSEYFGVPYPFPKFGQVFVPEFSWGGMENPGAITLNEKNIYRGAVTQSRLSGRNDLILHEMAHMWFGDLVTMKWWNDLWLNESFATYAAALAQTRALKSDNSWIEFFSEKTWGYWQDQLVTTHPIETDVTDVRAAKSNIDGITYAKGGATLKQLHFFVGDDGFREGLQTYFKTFGWGNTRREDFVGAIAKASKTDLKKWSHDWLQTSGPNKVQAGWSCKDSKIAEIGLIQTPSVSRTLSPHRTQLGLFKAVNDGVLANTDRVDVRYEKKMTKVPELTGKPCPDFVYPNVGDQDYALVSLDDVSVKLAPKVLAGGSPDPLLRLMVWNTLQQMVRDLKLTPEEYFNATIPGLENERTEAVLGIVAGRYSEFKSVYQTYLTPEQRALLAPRVENVVWKRVTTEAPGDDRQLTFFDFYLTIAQTPEALNRIADFLNGAGLPKGVKLDQDRRWRAIQTLAENGRPKIEEIIQAELKKDPSTTGQRSAYVASVAIPTKTAKEKFWADLKKPEKIPLSHIESAAKAFNNPNQPEFTKAFVEPYFAALKATNWSESDHLVDTYFSGLFPGNLCTKALLKKSRTELKAAKTLTAMAKRSWIEANDELARCVSVREHAPSKLN